MPIVTGCFLPEGVTATASSSVAALRQRRAEVDRPLALRVDRGEALVRRAARARERLLGEVEGAAARARALRQLDHRPCATPEVGVTVPVSVLGPRFSVAVVLDPGHGRDGHGHVADVEARDRRVVAARRDAALVARHATIFPDGEQRRAVEPVGRPARVDLQQRRPCRTTCRACRSASASPPSAFVASAAAGDRASPSRRRAASARPAGSSGRARGRPAPAVEAEDPVRARRSCRARRSR